MTVTKDMFEQYANRVETLVGEVRIDVLELKDDVAKVKDDVAKVKEDTKDLRRDIAAVKEDTKKTEAHLKHINGSIGEHSQKIHDIELARSDAYRAVGCPQTAIIKEMSESLMSAAVLKEYLNAQAKERNKQFAIWISIASAALALVTLMAMFIIG